MKSTFLSQRLLFGLILVFVALFDANAQDRVVTETTLGTLTGEITYESDTRISVFRGIPYALPPVGERRWKPTEAATAWDGKRLAIAFAPGCVQPIAEENAFYYAAPPLMSEDCLYLNVWTEAELPSSKKRPVMVYIHGGALIDGFGDNPLYDGASLARKGVVVVTINYRLNVFGYFAHEELNEESPQGASGNYGTLDQVQALRWVQENISAFGGDPHNVTIWGESAGALSVSHLMATPLSTGLFHRAIMVSAYMPPSLLMSQGRFEETSYRSCGKGSGVSQGAILEEAAGLTSLAGLRALPAAELMKVYRSVGFYPETVVDGYVFPEDIHEVFARGGQHNVPLLAGFDSGEVNAFGPPHQPNVDLVPAVPEDAAHYVAEVQARFGDLSDEYLALYPADDIRASVFAATRDGFYGWAMESFVRKMDQVNASAFFFYFDHSPASDPLGLGAFHTSELPYMFNNVKNNARYSQNMPDLPQNDTTLGLADVMSDYTVAFAKHGKPDAEGRPVWPAYQLNARHYMAFRNGTAIPGTNLLPGMFELHDEIVARRRSKGEVAWWLQDIGLNTPIIKDQPLSACSPANNK